MARSSSQAPEVNRLLAMCRGGTGASGRAIGLVMCLWVAVPLMLPAQPPLEEVVEDAAESQAAGPPEGARSDIIGKRVELEAAGLPESPPPATLIVDNRVPVRLSEPQGPAPRGMNGGRRPRARRMHRLMDGERDEARADGTIVKRRFDALEQAREVVPSARFVRAFPGDSLAKFAAEHGLDANKLALLNRTVVERVYSSPDVICLRWTHTVRTGESLETLAGIYNIEVRSLAQLNDLVPHQPLDLGQALTVPGEYQYHYHENRMSSLMLTQYVNEPAELRPGQRVQIPLARDALRTLRAYLDLGPAAKAREGIYEVELKESVP